MRDVRPPREGDPLRRSVVASLASILELEAAAVPLPPGEAPWTAWRAWLGERGLGLVPIAEPGSFEWPGPWLALLRAAEGDGQVAVVAYGAPPGVAWHPLGGPERFDAVQAGFLVAPADVALWAPADAVAPPRPGAVEALLVAPRAEAPMQRVERVKARAGRGLEGDRYADGAGTFSDRHGLGHDLTLIEGEVLDALGDLAPEAARRNVVTRGIELTALIGRRFRVGEVECVGRRRCEPCAHLERLTRPGALRALVRQGGLRADVLGDGELRVGDAVVAL